MAVFVSTTFFGDQSNINDALKTLENLRIKNIEIGSNHAPIRIEDLRLVKGTTYICHNYFPPLRREIVLNIASEDKVLRKKSIAFIKNTIILCQKLEIKFYTIHSGFFADVISPHHNEGKSRNFDFIFQANAKDKKQVLERTIEIIKDLSLFAKRKNVQLLIENQGSKTSKEFTLFDSSEELDILKREVGGTLKFNFNLAHAILAGLKLEEEKVFKHFYESSAFFEVSEIDRNLDSHLPIIPDKGLICSLLEKYATMFAKNNIILEYRNLRSEDLKKSYDFVTKLLNGASPEI